MKSFLVGLCFLAAFCQISLGGDEDSSSQEDGPNNALKELENNVSSLWTYISGVRQKVEHDLHQLHKHQMEVSNKLNSLFGIELEQSDGHMHHMDQGEHQHPSDGEHDHKEHHDDEHHYEHHHGDDHSHGHGDHADHHDEHHDDHHGEHHDDDHHGRDHHNEHHHGRDHHDEHHAEHHHGRDHHDEHHGEDHHDEAHHGDDHHDGHLHDDHHDGHHGVTILHSNHSEEHHGNGHAHDATHTSHDHPSENSDGSHDHLSHHRHEHDDSGDSHESGTHSDSDHHKHDGQNDSDHSSDHESNDTIHTTESHHQQHHHHKSHRGHHHHQEESHHHHHHHHHDHHHGHHTSHKHSSKYDFAVCTVEPNSAIPPENRQNITGKINLWQKKNGTTLHIHIKIKGFKMDQHGDHSEHQPGEDHPPVEHLHGIHVHQEGDLSNGCQSTGPHFNPTGVQHGGPSSPVRHVGDLGNIECDQHGITNVVITDEIASLHGEDSIIGKAIVIHERRDDLGTNPDNPASLSSGDAGSRIACCVITKVDRLSMGHSHGHRH